MPQTAEVKVSQLVSVLERDGEAAIVERVHPSFATHAQAALRWSTTNPPLAQTPNHLAAFIGPDPGWPWFMYDWSGLHLWLTAAYARDHVLLKALRAGDDLHTANACELFSLTYPPNRRDPHHAPENAEWRERWKWKGGEDVRRLVAKRFIYRVLKGGDYTKPPEGIPLGVFGGKKENFIRAAKAWALVHGPVVQWMNKIREQVRASGEVRTAWGKRRRVSDRTPHAQRAGIDHMCQGTEAEILNETILLTTRRFGEGVRFKFQRHDFIAWAVREDLWTPETLTAMADIAEREITIDRETIKLEAKFYTRVGLTGEKREWRRA